MTTGVASAVSRSSNGRPSTIGHTRGGESYPAHVRQETAGGCHSSSGCRSSGNTVATSPMIPSGGTDPRRGLDSRQHRNPLANGSVEGKPFRRARPATPGAVDARSRSLGSKPRSTSSAVEAAHEEAAADEQRERQCDLDDDESGSQPAAARRGKPPALRRAAVLQRTRQVSTARDPGRSYTRQKPRAYGDRKRDRQHSECRR